jgi:hypothetical protein
MFGQVRSDLNRTIRFDHELLKFRHGVPEWCWAPLVFFSGEVRGPLGFRHGQRERISVFAIGFALSLLCLFLPGRCEIFAKASRNFHEAD